MLAVFAATHSVKRSGVLSGPRLAASVASRVGGVYACDWEQDIEGEEAYERWKALGLLDLEEEPGGLPKRQGEYSEDQDADDETTPQTMVAASNRILNEAKRRARLNDTDVEPMTYLDLLMRDGGA